MGGPYVVPFGGARQGPERRARHDGDGQMRAAPRTTRWYAGREVFAAATGRTRSAYGPVERSDTDRA